MTAPTRSRTRKKKRRSLTLRDRLSRLAPVEAEKLLGPGGKRLLVRGAKIEIPLDRARWRGDSLEVGVEDFRVKLTRDPASRRTIGWTCSCGDRPCVHVGSVFSLVLEEKHALGLSEPPRMDVPIENLTEAQLHLRALADREERAKSDGLRLRAADPTRLWTDYTVQNRLSGRSYRIALRGEEPGQSYCSCPDFRTNRLGTCKHLLFAFQRLRRKFPAAGFRRPYRRKNLSLRVAYGEEAELRLEVPDRLDVAAAAIVKPLRARPITDYRDLLRRLRRLEAAEHPVHLYPDAAELLERRLYQERVAVLSAAIRKDPRAHPLRRSLLEVELLPYQLDGIAFCLGVGRAVLADDMGLGKTIQGIGFAELLAREAGIRSVLVICPASIKSQWAREIERTCERDVQTVHGSAHERARCYGNGSFFTVCNYEQVLRDRLAIEAVRWDLILLDEAQRIKNWQTRTSQVIKGLRSRFALVLTGTPVENRLDELYSILQFVDDRRLEPAFRFFHRHRRVDEDGKVLGYRNLGQLRTALGPVLLRRTRADVMKELPPRTTEILRITPTDEQLTCHASAMQIVQMIVRKSYLTEMDLLRLQKALLQCRLAANSTFLVNREPPGHSSKLVELEALLDRLLREPERKVVLFSEWKRMLDLVEPLLERRGIEFVRLDGSVPQRKRQQLIDRFQGSRSCRVFLSTAAGSKGINLQAADTVIVADLPWNPAELEQRIGRAHRMGQRRPVHVYLLVTESTLEENLLATLAAKKDLASAALDADSDVDAVELSNGMEELRRRLERLLGKLPDAPLHERERDRRQQEADASARRQKVAEAGGELLTSALSFLGELLPEEPTTSPDVRRFQERLQESLQQCASGDENGRLHLTFSLPGAHSLEKLANALARLVQMFPEQGSIARGT